MKYKLARDQKEAIRKDIVSVLEPIRAIVLVYVFGSFIESSPFSDIDIAILTENTMDSPLDYELFLEIEIEDRVGYPIDIRILNNAPLSFCQNVIRRGQVILERDANVREEFMGKTLKQYFDFAFFRRRYLKESTNAQI